VRHQWYTQVLHGHGHALATALPNELHPGLDFSLHFSNEELLVAAKPPANQLIFRSPEYFETHGPIAGPCFPKRS
jgi:hypothetical protein